MGNDYRPEARILADGFVKGMIEVRKGMEAIAEALAKQPPPTLQIPPTSEKPDEGLRRGGMIMNNPTDEVVLEERRCGLDYVHVGHAWGGTDSPYWCPGVTCPECGSAKPGGSGRYCGHCKDFVSVCIEGHCLICGGLT